MRDVDGPDAAVIRDRLAALTGLASELLESPTLGRWMRDRADTLGEDPRSYRSRLLVDEEERRLLSCEVAVPESWLGRYPASWTLVGTLARRAVSARGIFRAISLGCAAGQEIFSVAMAAIDAGLPPSTFDLHGVDRNDSTLAQARKGRLPRLAVRSDLPPAWRSRLTAERGGWTLDPAITDLVRFHAADLLEDPLPVAERSVDLVMCRNVLIYLGPDARARLVRRAAALMGEEGRLMVGHADPPGDLREVLAPVDLAGGFAWRRRTPADERDAGVEPTIARRTRLGPGGHRIDSTTIVSRRAVEGRSESDRGVGPDPTREIGRVRRLADGGDLESARHEGEALAERLGSTPELETLLGTIASDEGRPGDAREHWRRALYLEPAHLPALESMVVLCDAEGDHEAADRYRRRRDRLVGNGGDA